MEHPEGNAKEAKRERRSSTRAAFPSVVEDFVKGRSADHEGLFIVHDDELNKDWKLKLLRIHKDKITQLDDGRFFACADLQEGDGKNSTKVDLDFYVKRTDLGWDVDEVLLHKVSGKPRFAYDSKNNRIPAKKPNGQSGEGKKTVSYVCPMDGYKSDRPGKCPNCGIDLKRINP